VSRFKHKQATVEDGEGNKVTIRALTPGEREQVATLAKDDRNRLPYFLLATCCLEPKLTEKEVKDEVPTELLDKACGQIMEWSRSAFEKKEPSPEAKSSAVASPSPLESSPAK
jgi:hypothetical protein